MPLVGSRFSPQFCLSFAQGLPQLCSRLPPGVLHLVPGLPQDGPKHCAAYPSINPRIAQGCPRSTWHLRRICLASAQMCPSSAQGLPRSAQDLARICPSSASVQDLPSIEPRSIQHLPNLCPRTAQEMPKVCTESVEDLPNICPTSVESLLIICPIADKLHKNRSSQVWLSCHVVFGRASRGLDHASP